jgi:hypothetical protein
MLVSEITLEFFGFDEPYLCFSYTFSIPFYAVLALFAANLQAASEYGFPSGC